MLRKPSPQQTALEMVSLDGLVPKDHLLRKIEAVIDFSFIHDRVAGLYCPDNGRPPLDPTLMFKALFVGYHLFGIRSERQLVREIEVNVAYRWFLGLQLASERQPFHLDHRLLGIAPGTVRVLFGSASKIGSSTSIVAVMQTRSRTVEMPSGLSLPLAFGMYTLLIGSGW